MQDVLQDTSYQLSTKKENKRKENRLRRSNEYACRRVVTRDEHCKNLKLRKSFPINLRWTDLFLDFVYFIFVHSIANLLRPLRPFRGGICPSRQCRRHCKIFASGVNFSIFTHFLCFFLTKTVKIRWNWRCKIFSLKIWRCKILDKFHVWDALRWSKTI